MADTKLAKVGITVKESWKDDISYEVLDYTLWRVQDGGDGCGYIAKRANIGVVPNSDDSVWIKATQAGQSIYDLAVKYGHFEGTEEEFEAEYQAVLQAARDAASETSATNTEIQEAEELRIASENERADAETARQESEITREAAESDRQIAENMRQTAETQRGDNETTRQSQETARESSEQTRQTNESTRQSNETARESAEQERTADFEALKTDMETAIGEADAATAAAVALNNQVAGDESARQQAEQSRVAAETQRQTAETQRGTNESTRQTQETARQTAESTRNTQETARQTAEGQRATAEEGRASAESGRVSAETSRVAAETARETQATSDHQRAESDHAIAAEDHATLDEKISHKADIDGSYDGMAVGIARNLEGRTDVTDSFFKRTTGGDAEVANGTAQLNEVKGKSQVWNQLVQNGNFADGISGWSINAALEKTVSDGVLHLLAAGSVGVSSMTINSSSVSLVSGHKYYLHYDIKHSVDGSIADYVGSDYRNEGIFEANVWHNIRRITSSISSNLTRLFIYPWNNGGTLTDATADVKDVFLLDLTLLGIDDLTTVEEVEAWLAENIGEQAYYPYNAGEVLNNRMTGVESIGFNLLDPATGKADIIGAYSDVYGNYYGITGTHGALTFTDKFGNTETITPDEDGKFLLETAGTLSVADAGEDCAVFLWWDGTQTEYKPYEKNVGALDVTHIYGKLNGEGDYVRVWPTGMPGIGDIKDSLKVVDGQVVAERKVGEIDLGTMTWTYESANLRMWGAGCPFNPRASWQPAEYARCGKYDVRIWDTNKDKFISPNGNARVYIKDTAYTDAATFKNAVSGVLYYFELLTPQVYTDLIYRDSESFADNTPVTLPVNYKVDNWGIERIAPQNTEEAVVTTKPELTMRYSIDAVEELNTHRDEIDDLYEKNEDLDQRKPEKYGEYPDMAVGSAKTIAGDLATDAEFKFRKTGGNDAVASGLAKLTAVYGKSLVWNQQVADANIHTTGTGNSSWQTLLGGLSLISGHKYLVGIVGKNFSQVRVRDVTAGIVGNNNTASFIYIAENNTNGTTGLQVQAALDSAWDIYSRFIDLTLMFGAGNEPATVAEFEAMFPLPYYDYNAGEIVSNKAEAIETTGFNQWDEEWEAGTLNLSTGANEYGGGTRSKNYVNVLGGSDYYIKCGSANIPFRVCYYDANKGFISSVNSTVNNVFSVPADAMYLRFATYSSYGNTYKGDICINLSDPSRNGEYEPYRKYTLPLNIPTLTGKLNGEGESVVVCPEGLKSAGSVRDELVIKNGYATSVIKRVGIVDLGTLDWVKGSQNSTVFYVQPSSIGANAGQNFFTSRAIGKSVAANTAWAAATFMYTNDERYYGLAITSYQGESLVFDTANDSAYGVLSAEAFKTAMDGVLLYYELATPEEYILDEPFYVGYQEDANGTEKRLPEDTAESVMPALPCKIAYPIDVVKTINELGNTYVPRVEYSKYGVISQTQRWSGSDADGYTYTLSDIVRGWIPQANIDLYESAGAVFNPTTGYFELNGITNLSYNEIKAAYNFTYLIGNGGKWTNVDTGYNGIRTNFPLSNGVTVAGGTNAKRANTVLLYYLYSLPNCEVLKVARGDTFATYLSADSCYILYTTNKVREIVGAIGMFNVPATVTNGIYFLAAGPIEKVFLHELRTNWNASRLPRLNLASVVYAVEHAANAATAITITLHATAFARCQADTTEYTYNSQTYTGIIALAAAKNITIQSA